MSRERIDWKAAPIVTIPVVAPSCPNCGHGGYIGWSGHANGDGSTSQRAICKECSTPFWIIREPSSYQEIDDESVS